MLVSAWKLTCVYECLNVITQQRWHQQWYESCDQLLSAPTPSRSRWLLSHMATLQWCAEFPSPLFEDGHGAIGMVKPNGAKQKAMDGQKVDQP